MGICYLMIMVVDGLMSLSGVNYCSVDILLLCTGSGDDNDYNSHYL